MIATATTKTVRSKKKNLPRSSTTESNKKRSVDVDAPIKDFNLKLNSLDATTRAEDTDALTLLARSIERYRLLTPDEEKYLTRKAQDGDEDARNVMITSNLRLVFKIATKFTQDPSTIQDVFQEGTIGLMHAIELFDLSYGTKFATYASYWVELKIRQYCDQKTTPIRLPTSVQKQLKAMRQAMNEFELMNVENPTDEDLAEAMNIPVEKVKKLREYQYTFTSFQAALDDDENNSPGARTVSDYIESKLEQKGADELVVEDDRIQALYRLMEEKLSPQEQEVIKLRFGLGNYEEPKTQAQIGEIMGVTKQRIQFLEKTAKKTLREEAYGDPVLLALL